MRRLIQKLLCLLLIVALSPVQFVSASTSLPGEHTTASCHDMIGTTSMHDMHSATTQDCDNCETQQHCADDSCCLSGHCASSSSPAMLTNTLALDRLLNGHTSESGNAGQYLQFLQGLYRPPRA